MSTRSHIGILQNDGSVEYIYCHCDGYLRHNGRILLENVKTLEEAKKVIAVGDQSSISWIIDPEREAKGYGHSAGVEPTLEDYLDNLHTSDIEYCYLFDPKVNKWFVASEHAPIARDVWDDTSNLFDNGINGDSCIHIPWEKTCELKQDSVYGKAARKLYPVSLLLAYELIKALEFHTSNANYSHFVESDKEELQECLSLGLFTADELWTAENLDKDTEAERLAGLEELKAKAKELLNLEIEKHRARWEAFNSHVSHHDPKGTAKLLKQALKAAGYKNISVRSNAYYESVSLSCKEKVTPAQAEQINAIVGQFNDAKQEYTEALHSYKYDDFTPKAHYDDYTIIDRLCSYYVNKKDATF